MIVVQAFQATHFGQLLGGWHGEAPAVAQLRDLSLDVLSGLRWERFDQGAAGRYRAGVEVDELRDALRDPVGHARYHDGGVTVSQENDVVEVLELHEVDDILYVRLQVYFRAGEMRPLAQPGEGDGVGVVALVPQPAGYGLPAPATEPGTTDQHVGCHSLHLLAIRSTHKTIASQPS